MLIIQQRHTKGDCQQVEEVVVSRQNDEHLQQHLHKGRKKKTDQPHITTWQFERISFTKHFNLLIADFRGSVREKSVVQELTTVLYI